MNKLYKILLTFYLLYALENIKTYDMTFGDLTHNILKFFKILIILFYIYFIIKYSYINFDFSFSGFLLISSKNLLTKKVSYWYNPIRNMQLTGKQVLEQTLNLVNKNKVLVTKNMSFYRMRKGEKTPIDQKALKNNPVTTKGRHNEVIKSKCSDKNCDKKICPPGKACVPPIIEEKAVANTTHGTKNTSSGTNQELDPNQDYSGNNKAQKAIFYKDAHDVGPSTEIPNGTNFLNQPHVLKVIKKYEDKK